MTQLSLVELNRFVRRVLALNFPEALWVEAEVAQVNESRGHFYLTLVQKAEENDQLLAQAEARLWSSQLPALRREHGRKVMDVLRVGVKLRLQVSPAFHERFGFSLTVLNLDPSYTEGQLEVARRHTLEQLQISGDLDRNADLVLPTLPQRLAVISAETAAGYADFKEQLINNESGYSFDIQLFPAAMQGELAVPEIRKRLREIARWASAYDAIVIIRGGGSKMDLIAFNDLELCRQVATSPLPVISGIGHEIDESILDLVAHTALKTPTAVATFFLDRAAHFDGYLLQAATQLERRLKTTLGGEELSLDQVERRLQSAANRQIAQEKQQLIYCENRLPRAVQQQIQKAELQLDNAEKMLSILDPKAVLERGYAMISKGGVVLASAKAAKQDDEVAIKWADGQRKGKIVD